MKRIFLWTLIIALCVSALLCIALFLLGRTITPTAGRVLATTVFLGLYSMAGFCQSFAYHRISKSLSTLGFLVTALSYVAILSFIWFENYILQPDFMLKLILVGALFTLFATHASLMSLMTKSHRTIRMAKMGTILCSLAAVLLASYSIVFPVDHLSAGLPTLYRLINVFTILAVLGTLVTPMLSKLANNDRNKRAPE